MAETRSLKFLKLFFVAIFLIENSKALKCFKVIKNATSTTNNPSTLNETVVLTEAGLLQGKVVENLGSKYFSFKGIPYAEPPIGKLRFQAPVPKTSWTGVRPALEHGTYCVNSGLVDQLEGGSEDCLFLNVYTPSMQGSKSVMFWVHGGGYTVGNGDTSFYGPEHLVKEDVVLVTINYRLAVFGFLSTYDENAPGNAGLKDMVLALKWVQKNIAKFGGNPNDVTIFGQSAGSAAIHSLIISDSTNGLFHKAIMQSGSTLMPGLFQSNPLRQASQLCGLLNITFSDTKDMIEKLQAVDYQKIYEADDYDNLPCVEPQNTANAIFTEKPIESMLKESYKKIPLMLGGTNFERLDAYDDYFDSSYLADVNSEPSYIVPPALGVNETNPRFSEAVTDFKNIYFANKVSGDALEWMRVDSEFQFTIPDDRVARFCSATQHPPIYFYEFAFEGTLNPSYAQRQSLPFQIKGAVHGEELFYLFEASKTIFPDIFPDVKSSLMRARMTKMWSNFAKYGNPTPEETSLLPVKWNPYTSTEKFYFEIDEVSTSRQNLPRMNAVSDLFVKYTGHF